MHDLRQMFVVVDHSPKSLEGGHLGSKTTVSKQFCCFPRSYFGLLRSIFTDRRISQAWFLRAKPLRAAPKPLKTLCKNGPFSVVTRDRQGFLFWPSVTTCLPDLVPTVDEPVEMRGGTSLASKSKLRSLAATFRRFQNLELAVIFSHYPGYYPLVTNRRYASHERTIATFCIWGYTKENSRLPGLRLAEGPISPVCLHNPVDGTSE